MSDEPYRSKLRELLDDSIRNDNYILVGKSEGCNYCKGSNKDKVS